MTIESRRALPDAAAARLSGDRGSVLLPVLVLSAILAWLATAVLLNLRALSATSTELRDSLRARALADSGIARAVLAYATAANPVAPADPLRDRLKPDGRQSV